MKKYFVAFILIILCFVVASPARAAFWSKWFKKKAAPVENIAKPAPVDTKDVERRVQIATQIAMGVYQGPSDVSLSFTQEEAKAYLLPLANKNLKNVKSPVPAEIKDIVLSNGVLEVGGQVGKPVNSFAVIQVAPRVANGAVKVDIVKVKLGWITLPKAVINKLLAANKVDLAGQSWKLPHFTFSAIEIKDGRVTLTGKYRK